MPGGMVWGEVDRELESECFGEALPDREGGVVPPASKRAKPGWVMPARSASWRAADAKMGDLESR
jgi:hypothetical protein